MSQANKGADRACVSVRESGRGVVIVALAALILSPVLSEVSLQCTF